MQTSAGQQQATFPLPRAPRASTPARHGHPFRPLHPLSPSTALAIASHKGELRSVQAVQNMDAIVHLASVPVQVTDGYILDLCSAWGTVVSIARKDAKEGEEVTEAVVTYTNDASAKEAIAHLKGGAIFETRITAQLRSAMLSNQLHDFQKMVSLNKDDNDKPIRRGPTNLYVLNLPLSMTTEELEKIFAIFGTVEHTCILAVHDAQRRRRAFVDMDTSEAAQAAIANLSGKTIGNYILQVSYAIIQKPKDQNLSGHAPSDFLKARQEEMHISMNPQYSASNFIKHQQLQERLAAAHATHHHNNAYWMGLMTPSPDPSFGPCTPYGMSPSPFWCGHFGMPHCHPPFSPVMGGSPYEPVGYHDMHHGAHFRPISYPPQQRLPYAGAGLMITYDGSSPVPGVYGPDTRRFLDNREPSISQLDVSANDSLVTDLSKSDKSGSGESTKFFSANVVPASDKERTPSPPATEEAVVKHQEDASNESSNPSSSFTQSAPPSTAKAELHILKQQKSRAVRIVRPDIDGDGNGERVIKLSYSAVAKQASKNRSASVSQVSASQP